MKKDLVLYHGTSSKNLDRILKDGLLPRKITGLSNYGKELESRPDMIYLTSDYPVYYANIAASTRGGEPVIIQVKVSSDSLYPDEDFVAVALSQGDVEKERALIRKVDVRQYKQNWRMSLEYMSTVCTPKVRKDQILSHHVFEEKSLDLQISLGLDTNPAAFVRYAVSLDTIRAFRDYRGLIDLLFSEGQEAVYAEIERRQANLNKIIQAQTIKS